MFLQNIFGNDTLTLVIFLAVFIVIGYKLLEVLRNVIIIGILAAAFPYVLNYLDFSFQTSLNSELQYIIAGIGLYLLYELAKIALGAGGIVWTLAKLAAKPIAWIYGLIEDLFREENGAKKNEDAEAKETDELPKKSKKRKRRNYPDGFIVTQA